MSKLHAAALDHARHLANDTKVFDMSGGVSNPYDFKRWSFMKRRSLESLRTAEDRLKSKMGRTHVASSRRVKKNASTVDMKVQYYVQEWVFTTAARDELERLANRLAESATVPIVIANRFGAKNAVAAADKWKIIDDIVSSVANIALESAKEKYGKYWELPFNARSKGGTSGWFYRRVPAWAVKDAVDRLQLTHAHIAAAATNEAAAATKEAAAAVATTTTTNEK